MKNKTYTVKFFKDLINNNGQPVRADKGLDELNDEPNHELEDFFSALFSPPPPPSN